MPHWVRPRVYPNQYPVSPNGRSVGANRRETALLDFKLAGVLPFIYGAISFYQLYGNAQSFLFSCIGWIYKELNLGCTNIYKSGISLFSSA